MTIYDASAQFHVITVRINGVDQLLKDYLETLPNEIGAKARLEAMLGLMRFRVKEWFRVISPSHDSGWCDALAIRGHTSAKNYYRRYVPKEEWDQTYTLVKVDFADTTKQTAESARMLNDGVRIGLRKGTPPWGNQFPIPTDNRLRYPSINPGSYDQWNSTTEPT